MTHAREGIWKKRYKNSERRRAKRLMERESKRRKWRRRLKIVRYALRHGVRKAHEVYDVSIRTIYRWLTRYRSEGPKGLFDRSRRPKNPRSVSPEIVSKVIALRRELDLGCGKIAIEVGISPTTVNNILKRAGLNRPRKKKRVVIKHFERKHSNTLWQLDFTQIYHDLWLLLVIDDHSRFIVGWKLMESPNVEDTISTLRECFAKYGVPKQILTDHGSQFYAVRGGVSTFTMFCLENHIQHILAGVRHPQTCGKVERKLGIIKEQLERFGAAENRVPKIIISDIIQEFVQYHNYSRIHYTYKYYTCGDVKVKRKIHFIPFLRFAAHNR